MKNEREIETMTKFTTITELQILKAAYYNILNDLTSEIERNEECLKERGRDSVISKHWIDTYTKQLDELHEAILKLEQRENA